MGNLLVEMLNFNQIIDFQLLITCLLLYMIIIWGGVSYWVLKDAIRRYGAVKKAYAIAVFVFIFSFPALILYLLFRKDIDEDVHYELENLQVAPIPLADLTKDGEVKFRIEVNIIPVHKLGKLETVKPDIKVKLIEYMRENLPQEKSEVDKKIKKHINKLINLLKQKNPDRKPK